MKKIAENVLKHADEALKIWETDAVSLDDILDRPALRQDNIRGTVTDLLFSYFRHKSLIDALIAKLAKKVQPPLKRILALAMTQAFYQSGINPFSAINVAVDYTKRKHKARKAGFVNGVLRNSQRLDYQEFMASQSDWVKAGLPKSLYQHWAKAYSKEQVAELADVMAVKPELTFRVLGDIDEQELLALAEPLDNLPDWAEGHSFFQCTDNTALFAKTWLDEGLIYIQDPSTAMAPAMTTGQFESILDVCSAPGGKSLQLAANHPEARLVLNDRSAIRHKRTIANVAKLPQAAQDRIEFTVADALALPFEAESFDCIFLDVPCSNTGVIRHKPDAIWRYSRKRIDDIVELQSRILAAADKLLKPGGTLIYSTCSIEPAENTGQVNAFLEQYANYSLQKEQQLLPSLQHDGCYAANLRKA